MRKINIIIILVLGLASCSSTEKPRLKGHVLGTISTSIFHVNLEDDSIEDELVYKGSSVIEQVDSINYIYPDTIIFKEGSRIDKSNIIKYNLRTKEKTIIGNGIRPQYIKKINAIFYYKMIGHNYWLVRSNLDDLDSIKFITQVIGKCTFQNTISSSLLRDITMISPSTILYADENFQIKKYNFITEEHQDTELENCIPLGYIEPLEQIICRKIALPINNSPGSEIVTVDINSWQEVENSLVPKYGFVSYLPDINALIYSKATWPPYSYDLYLFSYDSNRAVKIRKGLFFTAVWLKDFDYPGIGEEIKDRTYDHKLRDEDERLKQEQENKCGK